MSNRSLYIGIIGVAYEAMQMQSYKRYRAEQAEPAEAVLYSEEEVAWLREKIIVRQAAA